MSYNNINIIGILFVAGLCIIILKQKMENNKLEYYILKSIQICTYAVINMYKYSCALKYSNKVFAHK